MSSKKQKTISRKDFEYMPEDTREKMALFSHFVACLLVHAEAIKSTESGNIPPDLQGTMQEFFATIRALNLIEPIFTSDNNLEYFAQFPNVWQILMYGVSTYPELFPLPDSVTGEGETQH